VVGVEIDREPIRGEVLIPAHQSFPDLTGPVLKGMGHDIGCGLDDSASICSAIFCRRVMVA